MSKSYPNKIFLICLIILAFTLRTFNTTWDDGYNLHPDERQIFIVTQELSFPDNVNPHFFAYGSLPLYILKFTSSVLAQFQQGLDTYAGFAQVGRPLSALFDTMNVLLIFLFAKTFLSTKASFLSAFLYTIAVFPIQNAHFYTVDSQLTFWSLLTLFLLTKAFAKKNTAFFYSAVVCTAAAIATKIVGLFLLPFVLGTLFFTQRNTDFIKKILVSFLLLMFALFVFQPYMFLDFSSFWSDISSQLQMARDATVFPFTIQYLGTTPYVYPFMQIFLWGLGPITTLFGFGGLILLSAQRFTLFIQKRVFSPSLVWVAFFWIFFIFFGASAVKFMRYYLPLYPFLVIGSIYFFQKIWRLVGPFLKFTFIFAFILLPFLWLIAFMNIHTKPHPWVTATQWIHEQIPQNSVLAVEHWDHALPLYDSTRYSSVTLELYLPDSQRKILSLVDQLARSDYIIISSNRLYGSIPKWRQRYPATVKYYDLLFNEQAGFEQIAKFETPPTLFGISVNDLQADESFSVYDHPTTYVFKKTRFNKESLRDTLLDEL